MSIARIVIQVAITSIELALLKYGEHGPTGMTWSQVVTQHASKTPAVLKFQATTACHRVLAFGRFDGLSDLKHT